MKPHKKLELARQYFDQGDISHSKSLLIEVEKELQTMPKSAYFSNVHANLGSLMIDFGSFTKDEAIILRGKCHTEYPIDTKSESEITIGQYYNLANGYIALWDLAKKESIQNGKIDLNYLKAKHYFRKALDLSKKGRTTCRS